MAMTMALGMAIAMGMVMAMAMGMAKITTIAKGMQLLPATTRCTSELDKLAC